MDHGELRRKVSAVLGEEERLDVDWTEVARLSHNLDAELAAEGYAGCPEVVRHYLCDDDIRSRDEAYAHHQRKPLRAYIETGEYHDSKPVPWRGCVLAVALPGAALVWLLL